MLRAIPEHRKSTSRKLRARGVHVLPEPLQLKKVAELQGSWELDPERFKVCFRDVHHGDKERNPMGSMCFFDLKGGEGGGH